MELKHSKIGIASFITSMVFGFLIFTMIVIAGVLEATIPGGLSEDSIEAIIVGLLIIAFLLAELVAFTLGIAGLFQNERKKVFAILGMIFSGGTIFGTILLIVIGNAM